MYLGILTRVSSNRMCVPLNEKNIPEVFGSKQDKYSILCTQVETFSRVNLYLVSLFLDKPSCYSLYSVQKLLMNCPGWHAFIGCTIIKALKETIGLFNKPACFCVSEQLYIRRLSVTALPFLSLLLLSPAYSSVHSCKSVQLQSNIP